MVEHRLAKARVEGSNPFSRSIEIIFNFTLIQRTSILLDALTTCTKESPFLIPLWFLECHQVAKMVFSECQFFSSGGDLTESGSAIKLGNRRNR